MRGHYRGPKDLEADDGGVREAFERAWERAKDTGEWELDRAAEIVPFPERRTALILDFALRNTTSGEVVSLEILGF